MQLIWSTRIDYVLGNISKSDVSKRIGAAVQLMKVSYRGDAETLKKISESSERSVGGTSASKPADVEDK